MPIFYLHLCNGNGFIEHQEGTNLSDLAAARAKAIDGLRDLSAHELRRGMLNLASFIEIEDEAHAHLATVHFTEAVSVTTKHTSRAGDSKGAW